MHMAGSGTLLESIHTMMLKITATVFYTQCTDIRSWLPTVTSMLYLQQLTLT